MKTETAVSRIVPIQLDLMYAVVFLDSDSPQIDTPAMVGSIVSVMYSSSSIHTICMGTILSLRC